MFLEGIIWDTQVMERLVNNQYQGYSLDDCLKRRGKAKNDLVSKYVDEHKLWTIVTYEGKKKTDKRKHYDKVPADIMIPYGLQDSRDALFLGMKQICELTEIGIKPELIANECELVKSVYEMESRGIQVDTKFCQSAMIYENHEALRRITDIESLTKKPFKSGPTWLAEILTENGIPFKKDEDTGNPILDKFALQDINTPLTELILEMRDHEKKSQAFYSTMIHKADKEGVIHANYLLAGTHTGRFSCSNPNIQQMPKEDKPDDLEKPFLVRGAFVPRKDCVFVMMDYDQMEYRLLADYAGEMDMIEKIMNGLDPHTYVANLLGVNRKVAKTLNFGLLYGMGVAKFAKALNVSEYEAKQLKYSYFAQLPRIKQFQYKVQDVAKSRGYIFNRYGRHYRLKNPDLAYQLLNHLIQGTGADTVRHVMPKLSSLLRPTNSRIVAQVHDELLFEFHKDDLHLVPKCKEIMENTYPSQNGMKLTVGIEWSDKSWATKDKKEWTDEQQYVSA
jgi:DNA polymerase-1